MNNTKTGIVKSFNKEELKVILKELDYYNYFKCHFLKRKYNNINYGKRIGVLSFDGLFSASEQYPYNLEKEKRFSTWHNILNNKDSSSKEIFCTVLEIFEWGNVLRGNVNDAIKLYNSNKIKHYIAQISFLLNRKEIIDYNSNYKFKKVNNIEILWSGGWTKVYHFINKDFLIYDSRVSAFLNYTLTKNKKYNSNQLKSLNNLTQYLFSFEGVSNEKRKRIIEEEKFLFRRKYPSGIEGFNANLISTWIIHLLNKELNIKRDMQSYERAFFMLGFDLNQIKSQKSRI